MTVSQRCLALKDSRPGVQEEVHDNMNEITPESKSDVNVDVGISIMAGCDDDQPNAKDDFHSSESHLPSEAESDVDAEFRGQLINIWKNDSSNANDDLKTSKSNQPPAAKSDIDVDTRTAIAQSIWNDDQPKSTTGFKSSESHQPSEAKSDVDAESRGRVHAIWMNDSNTRNDSKTSNSYQPSEAKRDVDARSWSLGTVAKDDAKTSESHQPVERKINVGADADARSTIFKDVGHNNSTNAKDDLEWLESHQPSEGKGDFQADARVSVAQSAWHNNSTKPKVALLWRPEHADQPALQDEVDDVVNDVLPEGESEADVDVGMRRWFGHAELDHSRIKERAQTGDPSRETIVQVVYKTLSATFEGPIAGYSTLELDPQAVPTPFPDSPQRQPAQPTPDLHADVPVNQAPQPTPQPNLAHLVPNSQETPTQEANKSSAEMDPDIPTIIRPPSSTPSINSLFAEATGLPPLPPSGTDHNSLLSTTGSSAALTSPTANAADMASSSADSNSGTSIGQKAAIAMGTLAGVFIVGLIVLLIFRHRKNSHRQRLDDDEKHSELEEGIGAHEFLRDARGGNPQAPRISLRPVTQFLPNWTLEKHTSREPDPAHTSSIYSSDRPITTQSTRSVNPFGNHAERPPSPIREEDEGSVKSPSSPNRNLTNDTRAAQKSHVDGAAVGRNSISGTAVAVGVTAGAPIMKRMTSINRGHKQIDLTTPSPLTTIAGNPDGTRGHDYSTAFGPPSPTMGAAAIAAAGGPANSTVHRVQLAFKPTLDDEMELKTGELIRLLHEYDDGWALVIRLDRSQQGVVPRTCFSARPVKPRPQQNRPPVIPSGYPAKSPASSLSPQAMPPQGIQPKPYGNGPSSATRPQPALHGLPPLTSPTLPTGRPTSPIRLPSLVNTGQQLSAGQQASSLGKKLVPGQAF